MGEKMQFDLNLYSKYRTELMGIAAIMVIISHMHDNGVEMYEPIRQLTGLGASGVELFLFVSGFGLWKSLRDATNGTFAPSAPIIGQWYLRRYMRILIPYLIFAIPIYGILSVMDHVDVAEYIKRVTFVSFWTTGWGLWYVAMLIPLYLFSPLLIRLLSGKNKIVWLAVCVLMTILYAYFGCGGKRYLSLIRFVVSRLPVFFIGIFMAQAICEGKKVSLWYVLILPLLAYFCLRALNHTIGTRFFYLWLLPLPFSTIGVWLVKRFGWLQSVCEFMGQISLEAYCTHAFVPACIVRAFCLTPSLWTYLFGVGVSIILSVGINRLSKMIIGRISGR